MAHGHGQVASAVPSLGLAKGLLMAVIVDDSVPLPAGAGLVAGSAAGSWRWLVSQVYLVQTKPHSQFGTGGEFIKQYSQSRKPLPYSSRQHLCQCNNKDIKCLRCDGHQDQHVVRNEIGYSRVFDQSNAEQTNKSGHASSQHRRAKCFMRRTEGVCHEQVSDESKREGQNQGRDRE